MKNKEIKEILLARYKRANKSYKATILAKSGYSSEQEYLNYLLGVKVKKEKVTIHNVFIMDDSGSMSGGKYNNGVKGIRELVKSIQADNLTNNTITIVDLNRGRQFWMVDSKETINYTTNPYLGGTPLYKTLGATIESLLKNKNKEDKVLLNITTDGQDTDGFGKYANLPQTIKDIQLNDNFTVTFIGTQEDVEYSIARLNIDRSNTLVHDNTALGMEKSFMQTSSARTLYSSRASVGLDVLSGFYKQQETL